MVIANEFASVNVEFDTAAKGPRLRIEDVGSGMCIYLDPLELQALAWARHEDLACFTRPGFREAAADRLLGQALSAEAVQQAESLLERLASDAEPPPPAGEGE